MKKLTKKMLCASIAQQTNRGQVTFAEDVKQTEKGATAKNVISITFSDPKEAAVFEVDKYYTIEISE